MNLFNGSESVLTNILKCAHWSNWKRVDCIHHNRLLHSNNEQNLKWISTAKVYFLLTLQIPCGDAASHGRPGTQAGGGSTVS